MMIMLNYVYLMMKLGEVLIITEDKMDLLQSQARI